MGNNLEATPSAAYSGALREKLAAHPPAIVTSREEGKERKSAASL